MTNWERQPSQELDSAQLLAFILTFIPRTDFYPRQADNGNYYVIRKPLTERVVAAHLRGHITIGAYALSPDNKAKWLVFDADEPEHWHKLLTMADNLEQQDILLYRELSRRGGHLWLFTPPTPGAIIRRFAKQLLREYKIPEKRKDVPGIEIYPKQDTLVTGPGSLVRLPLGIHQVTGKRYSFVTADGHALAPTIRAQLKLLTNPTRVPDPFIEHTLARVPKEPERILSPPPRRKKYRKDRSDQPVSEKIKQAIPVAEFISAYVELDARGKGYCPFHDDQKKSFQVNGEHNFWSCYAGCGGGSIIDFWMRWREKDGEDSSFKATVTDLAGMLLK